MNKIELLAGNKMNYSRISDLLDDAVIRIETMSFVQRHTPSYKAENIAELLKYRNMTDLLFEDIEHLVKEAQEVLNE